MLPLDGLEASFGLFEFLLLRIMRLILNFSLGFLFFLFVVGLGINVALRT